MVLHATLLEEDNPDGTVQRAVKRCGLAAWLAVVGVVPRPVRLPGLDWPVVNEKPELWP